MRFVTERIVKVKGVPLVNPVHITQILFMRTTVDTTISHSKLLAFLLILSELLSYTLGLTLLYFNGCFATDFCSATKYFSLR